MEYDMVTLQKGRFHHGESAQTQLGVFGGVSKSG
jgi:hypothetical protein